MRRPISNVERSTSKAGGSRLRLNAARRTFRAAPLFALLATPAVASACAVCGGATDEHIVQAGNTVLWALLGLVGFIFSATGATIWFLWRKAHTPIPAHIALIESLSHEDVQADS